MSAFLCCSAQTDRSYRLWQTAEQLALEGKNEESLKYYEKAYALVRKTDPFRAANLCNDMSSAHYAEKRYQTSMQFCYDGLGHLSGTTNAPDSLYFKLYTSIATMHNALERRDSSDYYFEAADEILKRNKKVEQQIPLYVLHHYLHQGRSFWALHRYHHSIAFFLNAQALADQYGLSDELDYIESSLAEAYDLLGDHRKALSYRLAAIRHPSDDIKRKQGLYTGLSYTYQRLGIPDSALLWHQASWQLHVQLPGHSAYYRSQHLELLYLMGSLRRKTGHIDDASRYLDKAESYRREVSAANFFMKALILIEKGHIANSANRFEEAEDYFGRAFEAVSVVPVAGKHSPNDLIYPQTAVHALVLRAKTLYRRYQVSGDNTLLATAFGAFRELIRLNRMLYLDAAVDVNERRLLSYESQEIFEEAIPVAWQYYKVSPSERVLAEIFGWFESANASYVHEILNRRKMETRAVTPDLQEKERELLQKRALLASTGKSLPGMNRKQLDDLKIEWYRLKETERKIYPAGHANSPRQMSLDEVRKKLDGQSAFISYKWIGQFVYAYVVTNDTARFVTWKVNSQLLRSQLADLENEFMNNPGLGIYRGTQSAIGGYRALFEPAKKWFAGKHRIIVARDWQFNFLPFEVLETGTEANDFLANGYAFSYTYSAAFFWEHPFRRGGLTATGITFAPFVREQKMPNDRWSPVAGLDDFKDFGGELIWGRQATKQKFQKEGMGYQVLHLATHAYAQDDSPDDSFIQFYPGLGSRLYLGELYTLPLQTTRLLILSACSGGTGRRLRGEGNISLSQAIAQAGCPSVISTTWEANDRSVSFLTKNLHRYMKEGAPLDEALRQSRIDFFNDKDLNQYAHPYYWANLTLQGNYDPVYPESKRLLEVYILAAGVVLIAATLFWKKRRMAGKPASGITHAFRH